MDAIVRLRADLAVDSDAVREDSAGSEGARGLVRLRQVRGEERCVRQMEGRRIASVEAARDANHVVSARDEKLCEMTSNESGAVGDCDSHFGFSLVVIRRGITARRRGQRR